MAYVLTDLVICQPTLGPRADSAHPDDLDPQPDAGRRTVHRRKADIGAEVDKRQLLKQLGSSAFLDRRPAVDDDVLAQPGWLDPGSLEGERHAGIPPHVLELAQARPTPAILGARTSKWCRGRVHPTGRRPVATGRSRSGYTRVEGLPRQTSRRSAQR
jgi:hypothetical protein